jgi:hypothetical protein
MTSNTDTGATPQTPATQIPAELDHLVYAVPNLAEATAEFARLTGLAPEFGGAHVGLGTANFLVPVVPAGWPADSRTYLEILGPDPQQAGAALGKSQLGNVDSAHLQRWAIHPADFPATVDAAHAAEVPVGRVHEMSRATPEGGLLQWRLTRAEHAADEPLPFGGGLPFLIDWRDSVHPAERLHGNGSAVATLEELAFFGPDPQAFAAALAVLGIEAEVEQALTPGYRAVLGTPGGQVELSTEHGIQQI